MGILGIIPARYASTRFPGKPLADIAGKTMIRRVYERACLATSLDKVVIATDDARIADEAARIGAPFMLTREDHQSGTDRCAEVAAQFPDYRAIINIQGDEPYIDPRQIDLLCSCFSDPEVQLATLVKAIYTAEELFNPNLPKVVLNLQQQAVYFSRHPVPFIRNAETAAWTDAHQFYKHIGIYGYTNQALRQVAALKPSSLELAESLEQLRWVENGYRIQTRITDIETIAIDTPEDLERLLLDRGK